MLYIHNRPDFFNHNCNHSHLFIACIILFTNILHNLFFFINNRPKCITVIIFNHLFYSFVIYIIPVLLTLALLLLSFN